MIRSKAGISKISVSSEVDPGFGPDTEQRRVEFAAKLEEEAFSITVSDATKLAKANLITALKLWEANHLIKFVAKLELRDIMVIWLIFEISYIVSVWLSLDIEIRRICTNSEKDLKRFIDAILSSLVDDVTTRFGKVSLDLENIATIRASFGGDLIFSLKSKNDNEIFKIYEMIYSKLPESLRNKFYKIIVGVEVEYKEILKIVKVAEKEILKRLVKLITEVMKESDRYTNRTEEVEIITKIVEVFDKSAAIYFQENVMNFNSIQGDVNEKVKRYYGIDE